MSDYGFFNNYINCIERNLKMKCTEMDFKSDPAYREILEHVSVAQGQAYLDAIKREFGFWYALHHKAWIELCKCNDSIGQPIKYNYEGFCECSPTNLRYIHHALLILNHINDSNLDEFNDLSVIEIGGGYGGLAFFLFSLSPLFSVKFDTYTIFDLEAAVELQMLYAEQRGIKLIKGVLGDELPFDSYLISDYALGEMVEPLQTEYIEKVVRPYCNHGFLTWNGQGTLDVKGAHVCLEYPPTGHNHYIFF